MTVKFISLILWVNFRPRSTSRVYNIRWRLRCVALRRSELRCETSALGYNERPTAVELSRSTDRLFADLCTYTTATSLRLYCRKAQTLKLANINLNLEHEHKLVWCDTWPEIVTTGLPTVALMVAQPNIGLCVPFAATKVLEVDCSWRRLAGMTAIFTSGIH